MTKGTFPTAPEVAWTADPHDYMSGSTASFVNPEYAGRRYLSTGFVDVGDKLIAAIAKTQTDSNESRLIALNSRTGELEWSAPSTFGGGCANGVVEGALPCIESDFGRNPRMKSFNVHDGTIRSESALSPNTLAISVGEGSVFTAAYRPGEGEYTLTRGSVDNPASEWSRSYSTKKCGVGSGDHYALKISDGLVSLSGIGGVIALTSAGSVVVEDTAWAGPVPGFGAVAGMCGGNTNELTFTPTYFDTSGAAVFTSNASVSPMDFSGSPLILPHNTSGSPNSSASAAESVQRKFRFPIGTFWRTPDTLSGKSGGSWNKILVECVESGNASATTGVVGQQVPNAKMEATGPAAPQTGDAESTAFDALRALATADAPSVSSELADRWVPQLSSKRPGLVAEGKTWNNSTSISPYGWSFPRFDCCGRTTGACSVLPTSGSRSSESLSPIPTVHTAGASATASTANTVMRSW
ncbi:hypothetical protein [Rhodococcus sp. ARC_M6]|uniref:hypothetical protein n=1 Tax=Rhodococcus sp. ARC_M6 TaxID=2928852 RepID=UPI001FB46C72|nr:hypothetical protein [Rhodococcus sp. ARC_M6]MCJ0904761.1 hypothetical protein [Rhodococcus sp. ARC_M6]